MDLSYSHLMLQLAQCDREIETQMKRMRDGSDPVTQEGQMLGIADWKKEKELIMEQLNELKVTVTDDDGE